MRTGHRKKHPGKARRMTAFGAGIAFAFALLIAVGIWLEQTATIRAMEGAQHAYAQHISECVCGQADAVHHLYMEDEDHIVAIKNGSLSETTFRTQRAALQWLFDDSTTPQDESMAFATVETGTQDLYACVAAFIHISFDDVEYCFRNLTDAASYSSLFDEPFFGWLKELHDLYGAKFSLYSYVDILQAVADTYQKEFFAASDWLKIGLHADNSATYGNWDYDSAKLAWNTYADAVFRITGTYESLDRMPRLHYYAGSEEALRGMQDAHMGALGFLCADDNRVSYYLGETAADYLYTNDRITDDNGLIFLSTDMRGDWFAADFSTANQYRKPKYAAVYRELEYRYASDRFAYARSSFIFFSHEWKIYNGTHLNGGTQWVADICMFAWEHGIAIAYPQEWFFAEAEQGRP